DTATTEIYTLPLHDALPIRNFGHELWQSGEPIGHVPRTQLRESCCIFIGRSRIHTVLSRERNRILENPLIGAWRLKSIGGSVPKAAIFSMGAKPQGIL